MHGTVTVIDKGPIRIHSYTAPEDGLAVTTQLIETPSRIIAVDAQFVLAYADEAAAYARGLGKPLDRLVISHAHPDHYQGAARFDVPVHALPETIAAIVAMDDKTDLPTGTPIPLAGMTPTVAITPGIEVVDGVPFVFEKVTGGEIHTTLVIKLPEQGVLVAQDVVYDHTHLWFLDKDFDGWQANIDRFAAETGYDTVLPGHGEPTGPAVWAELTDYVDAGRELLGDDGDAYKEAITARYPDYRGAALIDIANAYLFGPKD
ncbi:MBL fold metallo-hydrolase [Streptomyces acidiscabies]|uniref:MBL fold metallo-hydrolase n=1 Tax=Streptomyces acidiscabies TaxID=42234 RepID=A0AAP6BET5_9ACTN|nr:MBL fold metallo-hydrolase [Streptomyces acidiscabies]MBP5942099.1 MBL fold metallo-hydrolase [Streptomyces sp. LBUM 1476]MBZ3913599.1 MBL fold metallo-hydrolase [Streptomyces acidiscabies]MDX2963435.1 MBL fold metallo-hydrolase [Streptomyces acidiscabies]MDX3023169.1 MBL fold metallo-hydrolase [Streptomyces acidiscabies]MDX3792685.1 MBL fold metallo-hydrolase [Streptomyces acidiscabies]